MSISQTDKVIFAIFFCFIGVFGLIANLFILIAVRISKIYRNYPSTLYLYNILVINVLACLYEVPYHLFCLVGSLPAQSKTSYETACRINVFLFYFLSSIKINLLTVMSVDRFIAIQFPYVYIQRVSKQKVYITLVLTWIITSVFVAPLSIENGISGYIGLTGTCCGVFWAKVNPAFYYLAGIVTFVLPALIMIVTNVRVYIVARKNHRAIRDEGIRVNRSCTPAVEIEFGDQATRNGERCCSDASEGNTAAATSMPIPAQAAAVGQPRMEESAQGYSIEWSIVTSTLLLVLTFFVTWLPFFGSRFNQVVLGQALGNRAILYALAPTLLAIVLNPLIIFGTRKKLRKFCFGLFTKSE